MPSYFATLHSYFAALHSYFATLHSCFDTLHSYFATVHSYFETVHILLICPMASFSLVLYVSHGLEGPLRQLPNTFGGLSGLYNVKITFFLNIFTIQPN